jgi:uncharacterized hydantoinase/oxoprolinase family protein
MVLGNIAPDEYKVETADGRGKTRFESLARLARVICADVNMLEESEILSIAKQIQEAQVEQVAAGLRQVMTGMKSISSDDISAIVTGIGKDFLARKAARKAGFKEIIDLEKLTKNPFVTKATPALAVALMVANRVQRRRVRWMQ